MNAVEVSQLTKRYGRVVGVDSLTFSVPEGSIFGFLGANGAGKTTTIRLLLGLIFPSAGTAKIFESDAVAPTREVLQSIGYLPGELRLYEDMIGEDLLDLYASFHRRGAVWRNRALDALELTGRDLRRRVREYSTGMKQKLGLVQALQHRPRLLILDEPTLALDPLMRRNFHHVLQAARGEGTTVFMSSHDLSEVERCCERTAIIKDGRLLSVQLLDDPGEERPHEITVTFSDPVHHADVAAPGVAVQLQKGNRMTLRVTGDLRPVLRRLADLPVVDMQCRRVSLEQVFLKYYGRDRERGEGDV